MFDGPDAPETLELDARLRPNMARDTAPEIADIDAEFLYPSDADVLDISNDGDGVRVRLAVPDPETGDGLVFEAPAPDRWYIGCPRASDLRAVTPDRVAGRNVDAFMPEGSDARAWRAWLNEVQMLLHDAPVNQDRERRGALPVNSVWLWGGGQCPAVSVGPERVYADEPVAVGLARLAGTAGEPTGAAPWTGAWPAGNTLAVDARPVDPLVHGEIETWLECLAALERDRFVPLARGLRQGDLDTLTIAVGDGRRFRVTRPGLRRFWRRNRPWTDWLGADA